MSRLKNAFIASALIAATTVTAMAQRARVSPHDVTGAVISGNRVTIYYGRPSAKGREIWGSLVPWDAPWRIGADEATTLVIQKPIVLDGKPVPAGAYTLYMIPSEKGDSKLVVSTGIGGWGIPVDTKHDLIQVNLKKTDLDAPVEELTLSVASANGKGVIKITWSKATYSVEFTNG